jgi:hypothetical protein
VIDVKLLKAALRDSVQSETFQSLVHESAEFLANGASSPAAVVLDRLGAPRRAMEPSVVRVAQVQLEPVCLRPVRVDRTAAVGGP